MHDTPPEECTQGYGLGGSSQKFPVPIASCNTSPMLGPHVLIVPSQGDWFAAFNPRVAPERQLNINLVYTFKYGESPSCVRFSDDGTFLAIGWDRSVQIFDIGKGAVTWCDFVNDNSTLNSESTTMTERADVPIRCICFSPDGKRLAVGEGDCIVVLFPTLASTNGV